LMRMCDNFAGAFAKEPKQSGAHLQTAAWVV
jgi:hypothetical protein